MGNAQTSVCFRVAWTSGDDPNDVRSIAKKLWPIPVKDIDLNQCVLGDFTKNARAVIITNVASN